MRHHRVGDAESVEHREYVWAKLDAVADDAELRRLLDEPHAKTLAAKRQRDSRAAEPSADHQNRILAARHCCSANQF